MKITQILAEKFPILTKPVNKNGFYHLLVPLNPTMYRDEKRNLILTGNQHITIASGIGGFYGIVSTNAKVRKYRTKNFNETEVNKIVVIGKTAESVAWQLVK